MLSLGISADSSCGLKLPPEELPESAAYLLATSLARYGI